MKNPLLIGLMVIFFVYMLSQNTAGPGEFIPNQNGGYSIIIESDEMLNNSAYYKPNVQIVISQGSWRDTWSYGEAVYFVDEQYYSSQKLACKQFGSQRDKECVAGGGQFTLAKTPGQHKFTVLIIQASFDQVDNFLPKPEGWLNACVQEGFNGKSLAEVKSHVTGCNLVSVVAEKSSYYAAHGAASGNIFTWLGEFIAEILSSIEGLFT